MNLDEPMRTGVRRFETTHSCTSSARARIAAALHIAICTGTMGGREGVQAPATGRGLDGKELLVNFTTQEGGHLVVGLLDESGTPITQFNLGECQVMKGDQVAQKVTWSGGDDISKFSGKPVRLMFELSKGSLWSFRFAK